MLKFDDVDGEDRVVSSGMILKFTMAGIRIDTQPDTAIAGDSDIPPLPQEGKRNLPGADPEPQVIAEAIAAFQTNNVCRRYFGLHSLGREDIPIILMVHTTPYFHPIPITSAPDEAVAGATFPPVPTTVFRFVPPLTRPDDGFRLLANCCVLFQYFESFQIIVNLNASSRRKR